MKELVACWKITNGASAQSEMIGRPSRCGYDGEGLEAQNFPAWPDELSAQRAKNPCSCDEGFPR
jgi:hypothetical protein